MIKPNMPHPTYPAADRGDPTVYDTVLIDGVEELRAAVLGEDLSR